MVQRKASLCPLPAITHHDAGAGYTLVNVLPAAQSQRVYHSCGPSPVFLRHTHVAAPSCHGVFWPRMHTHALNKNLWGTKWCFWVQVKKFHQFQSFCRVVSAGTPSVLCPPKFLIFVAGGDKKRLNREGFGRRHVKRGWAHCCFPVPVFSRNVCRPPKTPCKWLCAPGMC